MSSTRHEFSVLSRLAAPVILTQLTSMLMGMVDLLMVGRVGVEAIGAVSLGNVWKMSSLLVVVGVVFGMDPLVSQAHGARDRRGMGLALQRGIVVAILLSIPVTVAWIFTEPALVGMGQDPQVAHMAARYIQVQIPSIAPFLVFSALRQYLTGRGIMYPTLWVTVGANLVNVFLNWVLIFGALGFPALGSTGSGIATSIVQVLMMVGLVAWILIGRLQRAAWVPWSRRALRLSGLWVVVRKGLPVGLQLGLEMWAFNLATLLAGTLGSIELAAHSLVLNMASLSFMVPLGVAIGASARIGRLLGAGRALEAQRSAWVAFGLGAAAMSVAAAIFVLARNALPRLYTDDPGVIAMAATILPIAATFQMFDGVQVVGGGILRGMGRTMPGAVFNLIGYYLLAAPLAITVVLYGDAGLPGIWWSLAFGLGVVALSLMLWVWRKGPAHDPRAQLYGEADGEADS